MKESFVLFAHELLDIFPEGRGMAAEFLKQPNIIPAKHGEQRTAKSLLITQITGAGEEVLPEGNEFPGENFQPVSVHHRAENGEKFWIGMGRILRSNDHILIEFGTFGGVNMAGKHCGIQRRQKRAELTGTLNGQPDHGAQTLLTLATVDFPCRHVPAYPQQGQPFRIPAEEMHFLLPGKLSAGELDAGSFIA